MRGRGGRGKKRNRSEGSIAAAQYNKAVKKVGERAETCHVIMYSDYRLLCCSLFCFLLCCPVSKSMVFQRALAFFLSCFVTLSCFCGLCWFRFALFTFPLGLMCLAVISLVHQLDLGLPSNSNIFLSGLGICALSACYFINLFCLVVCFVRCTFLLFSGVGAMGTFPGSIWVSNGARWLCHSP